VPEAGAARADNSGDDERYRRTVNQHTRAKTTAIARVFGVPGFRWALIAGIAAATTVVYEVAPHAVRLGVPIVICSAATAAAVRAARRGPSARRTWLVLAAAMACFGSFAVLAAFGAPQSLLESVLGTAYVPTAYAVWLLAPRGTINRTAALLDLALILGAAAVVNWQIFLQPYRAPAVSALRSNR
jgi:hypothetical protein